MPIHDDPDKGRTRRKDVFRGLWGMAAVAAILILGFVFWAMYDHQTNTASNQLTASPPVTTGSAPALAGAQSESQPQGPTGSLNTTSGGAPASSPQGETPPGMQSNPQGSSGTTSGSTK